MFNTHLQVEFKLRSEFVFSFRIYVILALDCLRQGKRKGESAGGLEDAVGGWGGMAWRESILGRLRQASRGQALNNSPHAVRDPL